MALNINGSTGISGVDGSASAPALTGTDSNTGINFASDTVNINTGGSTKATVKSDGCLAVGTTTSAGLLNVQGTSYFGSDSNAKIYALSSGSEGRIGVGGISSVTNIPLTFYTADGGSNNERMRLGTDGFLGINITSEVTTGGGACFSPKDAGRQVLFLGCNTSGTKTLIQFQTSQGSAGAIKTSGSTTSYNTSSDYRLKENVTSISDGITRLKTLKPYRFNFKSDASTTLDGFLAHEVTAVPEAVTGAKDEVVTQEMIDSKEYAEGTLNDPIYQGIDQSKIVPLLTAALQEAVAKIEVLETKVAALEAG